jgi:hypothetical protein
MKGTQLPTTSSAVGAFHFQTPPISAISFNCKIQFHVHTTQVLCTSVSEILDRKWENKKVLK